MVIGSETTNHMSAGAEPNTVDTKLWCKVRGARKTLLLCLLCGEWLVSPVTILLLKRWLPEKALFSDRYVA